MKKVFISYSRKNLDLITPLIDDLQAVGIDVWFDRELTGGQLWWDNILTNIRQCDLFIFTLSPETWDSEACRSELKYVEQLGKTILPVLISGGVNINLLPPPLSSIQIIDCCSGGKEGVFALIKSINIANASGSLPDPLPPQPKVPISYLSTLKQQIDSAEPMSSDIQTKLFIELEEQFNKGRPVSDIRELLIVLKRRDDLLAKISNRVDAMLKRLDELSVTQGRINSETDEQTGPRSCPQCGTRAEPGQKFCASCGAVLGERGDGKVQTDTIPEGPKNPEVSGAKSRRYSCKAKETKDLIANVKSWLDSLGFDAQQMKTDSQSDLLQIKKRGGWRDYVGMGTSLNIVFHQTGDTLSVEIGAGKWLDKAAVGTVSLFILWPLAITAGLGAWEQMKMPEKIFDFIDSRLVRNR